MTEAGSMKILDYLAAKHAQLLFENSDMENTVTKALGVLQEHGVYACFLYLLAKEKDGQKGKKTAQQMIALLQESELAPDKAFRETSKDILNYVNENISATTLKKLLLIKDLLELMLVYSRYHAGAMEPEESKEEST